MSDIRFLLVASLFAVSCTSAAKPLWAFEEPPARQIAPGDVLAIEVVAEDNAELLLRPTLTVGVGKDGLVSLGARFPGVRVIGKTLRETEEAIVHSIEQADVLKDQRVNVRVDYLGHDSVDDPKLLREKVSQRQLRPRVIAAGDILQIESFVVGLNTRRSAVESDGNVALGARWGRVNVVGKTLLESEQLIRNHIASQVKDPEIQVTFGIGSEGRPDEGQVIAKLQQFERDIAEFKALIRELKALKPR